MIRSAFLVNDPFGDPGVYLDFKYRRNAFLFDMGDLSPLVPRQLLHVDSVFVSHTHMDHFIGFDHLLRLLLGRDKRLSLYGPPSFLKNLESKMAAYTWNLVANYTSDVEIVATEVHPGSRLTRCYRCRKAFQSEGEQSAPFDGTLTSGDFYTVKAAFLDHGVPTLGFRFEEHTRLNIKKNVLKEMGLPTGAWLLELKERIMKGEGDDLPIRIWWRGEDGRHGETFLPLGLLRERAVKVTKGQTIAYVTDAAGNDDNCRRIVELAAEADILFIEAPFLAEDGQTAARKFHLTARQAGLLARQARARRIVLFHFSPKYTGRRDELIGEAMAAFAGDEPLREKTFDRAAPCLYHPKQAEEQKEQVHDAQ